MGKYQQEAGKLMELVGGKSNIQSVAHCVTRMRFVLIDPDRADVAEIENLPSAKGTFTQAGQFQVIIGNDVTNFYNDFVAVSGIEGVSKDEAKQAAKTNQTFMQKLIGNLGEIFTPIIPALVAGGLILGFRNVIDAMYLFENGTKTLAEMSVFWSGVDSFLWLIGEAIFHFLPVMITWSITKKMGTSQVLGIILGITLVSPQLLNAYSVASTPASEIPVWDFGFAQIQMIGYQAQVIPAILAGFVLVYLERFFQKITPAIVSIIVVPFCSLVLSVLIAHAVVGPIGWALGDMISKVVYSGLMHPYGFIFAGFFGLVYAPLVITGLHHMTNAIDTQLISSFGGTILWPMIALSNIAQGSAVLGMTLLTRKNEKLQQVEIPAMISCYLGVTEPALFGVNLKYGFPLVCGMIGSGLAGMYSVLTGVTAASIGVGGLPGILSIMPQYWIHFIIAMAIAVVVPLALTLAVGQRKLSADIRKPKVLSGEKVELEGSPILSPVSGRVVALASIEDQVFASGAMGEGFAVEMTEGTIVSPVDGEVAMLFPTGHAVGLRDDYGREILIHVGMDTVHLNGEGFDVFVKEGDRVKKGQLLLKVDLDFIQKKGCGRTTPVVITSGQKTDLFYEGEADAGEAVLQTA